MNTRLQSSPNLIFLLPEREAEKNGLRISPINHDLTSAYTWATPQLGRFTGRTFHHDA